MPLVLKHEMLLWLRADSILNRAETTRWRNWLPRFRKYVDASQGLHSFQIMAAPTPWHAENVSDTKMFE